MELISLCEEAFKGAKRITALVRSAWEQREEMSVIG